MPTRTLIEAYEIDGVKATGDVLVRQSDGSYQNVGQSNLTGSPHARMVHIPLVHHFTALTMTVSLGAAWLIPSAAAYGQTSPRIDLSKLGTIASAELVVCYTNTAIAGTNKIGLVLGSAPVAAGSTVVPITSSQVTLANSSTYPQTIAKAITVSELGSTAAWLQVALNLAVGATGPNIFHAALNLYF